MTQLQVLLEIVAILILFAALRAVERAEVVRDGARRRYHCIRNVCSGFSGSVIGTVGHNDHVVVATEAAAFTQDAQHTQSNGTQYNRNNDHNQRDDAATDAGHSGGKRLAVKRTRLHHQQRPRRSTRTAANVGASGAVTFQKRAGTTFADIFAHAADAARTTLAGREAGRR